MKWRDHPGMKRALDELFDTLAGKSGGGGVTPSKPLAPQGVRGFTLFFDDGQVAVMDLEKEVPEDD